jgi:putative oxidoreductase
MDSKPLRITTVVARILLGLLFCFTSLIGFIFFTFSPPPAMPGLAGIFSDVLFRSHWQQFVDAVELIAGVFLLANRYVPLALTLLGAVIANILVFHITMQPQGLPLPLFALALWLFLAWRYRSSLAPIFVQKATPG